MVIDSSALLAILLNEPERAGFSSAIVGDAVRLASTATLFEASMVTLGRLGVPRTAELNALLRVADVAATPFTAEHVDLALDAFRRFGKGRHRAGLNFGNCMSYALARATGEPLLFKGDDFGHTGVASAFAP